MNNQMLMQKSFDMSLCPMNELSHIVMTRKKVRLLSDLCQAGLVKGEVVHYPLNKQWFYSGVEIVIEDSIGENPGWSAVYKGAI